MQGCRGVTIFHGSGSVCGSGKAFRLRLRLQVKHPECSGSGKNVPPPAALAPVPHILKIDPLKSLKFEPLIKLYPLDKQWFYVSAYIFITSIPSTTDNTLQCMTALQRHGCKSRQVQHLL